MDVEIKIDKNIETTKIVIYTKEMTDDISDLACKLSSNPSTIIMGFKDEKVFLLNRDDIFRFYTENNKIFASCLNENFKVKYRLYELEENLNGTSFIRISNSEIANFNKVSSLDMGISGTISLKFKNGDITFVSRRYVDTIKKYLNL